MPALKNLYGRDWNHGSDDLTVPSFLCGLTRTAWLIVGLVVYLTREISERCTENEKRFNMMSTVMFGVTWITYIMMFFVSNRGTVIEVEKRRAMPNIIRCLVLCVFVEFGFTVFGTLAVVRAGQDGRTMFTKDNPCYDLINAVVIGSWIEISITSCCGCIAFSFSSPAKKQIGEDRGREKKSRIIRLGRGRRRCGYCWGEGEEDGGETTTATAYREIDVESRVTVSNNKLKLRKGGGGNSIDDNNNDKERHRLNNDDFDEDDALMEDEEEEEEEDHYEFNSDEERESDRPRHDIFLASSSNMGNDAGIGSLDLASPFVLRQSRRLAKKLASSSGDNGSNFVNREDVRVK